MHARKQYLAEVRKEYGRADEKGRSRLLDEAEKRTGYNRKYLIRALNRTPRPQQWRARRRKAECGAALTSALIAVWDIFEQPCGQRLAAILRVQVDHLRQLGELRCSMAVAEQLKRVSASTIDRLLRREKRVRRLRRTRNPNVPSRREAVFPSSAPRAPCLFQLASAKPNLSFCVGMVDGPSPARWVKHSWKGGLDVLPV